MALRAGAEFLYLAEVKIRQVHLAFRDYVDSEHALSRRKLQLDQTWCKVPVMPLPPRHGIGRVECRHDRQRCTGRLSVYIQADASTAVRSVKQIRAVDSRVGNLDCNVEPLSGHGPADIELVLGWLNQIILRVVDLVVKFCIGDVDTLVHAELVQIGPVRGIESATAIVFRIRIVISDTFAAEVIESALHLAGNYLRSRVVAAVVVRLAFVSVEKIYSCRTNHRAREEDCQCEEIQNQLHGFLFHCMENPNLENRSSESLSMTNQLRAYLTPHKVDKRLAS